MSCLPWPRLLLGLSLSVNPLGPIVSLSLVSQAALHIFAFPSAWEHSSRSGKPMFPWAHQHHSCAGLGSLELCWGCSCWHQHSPCVETSMTHSSTSVTDSPACCHFSLLFVMSSSTQTLWEGTSPASAPEHHRSCVITRCLGQPVLLLGLRSSEPQGN